MPVDPAQAQAFIRFIEKLSRTHPDIAKVFTPDVIHHEIFAQEGDPLEKFLSIVKRDPAFYGKNFAVVQQIEQEFFGSQGGEITATETNPSSEITEMNKPERQSHATHLEHQHFHTAEEHGEPPQQSVEVSVPDAGSTYIEFPGDNGGSIESSEDVSGADEGMGENYEYGDEQLRDYGEPEGSSTSGSGGENDPIQELKRIGNLQDDIDNVRKVGDKLNDFFGGGEGAGGAEGASTASESAGATGAGAGADTSATGLSGTGGASTAGALGETGAGTSTAGLGGAAGAGASTAGALGDVAAGASTAGLAGAGAGAGAAAGGATAGGLGAAIAGVATVVAAIAVFIVIIIAIAIIFYILTGGLEPTPLLTQVPCGTTDISQINGKSSQVIYSVLKRLYHVNFQDDDGSNPNITLKIRDQIASGLFSTVCVYFGHSEDSFDFYGDQKLNTFGNLTVIPTDQYGKALPVNYSIVYDNSPNCDITLTKPSMQMPNWIIHNPQLCTTPSKDYVGQSSPHLQYLLGKTLAYSLFLQQQHINGYTDYKQVFGIFKDNFPSITIKNGSFNSLPTAGCLGNEGSPNYLGDCFNDMVGEFLVYPDYTDSVAPPSPTPVLACNDPSIKGYCSENNVPNPGYHLSTNYSCPPSASANFPNYCYVPDSLPIPTPPSQPSLQDFPEGKYQDYYSFALHNLFDDYPLVATASPNQIADYANMLDNAITAACPPLHPKGIYKQDWPVVDHTNYKCLESIPKGILGVHADRVISILEDSAQHSWNKTLQCVGFARAVAVGVSAPLDPDYAESNQYYTYITTGADHNVEGGVKVGDIAIFNGHIGIITSVGPGTTGFGLTEANGDCLPGYGCQLYPSGRVNITASTNYKYDNYFLGVLRTKGH